MMDRQLQDGFGRSIEYLRLSVTDRCDFRCVYCMAEDMTFLPRQQVLTLEELERTARIFVAQGVRKIRLTGGEPLLRKGLENLVEQLAGLRTLEGRTPDLTLTTNGSLLARKARTLKAAGLQRVTISLDSLNDAVFRRMNDVDFPVAEVLAGTLPGDAPDAAAVEQTFVNKDAVGTLKLGQARGIALLAPAQAGLSIGEYAPNAVKKAVVGVGHAGKEQVQHMVRHQLPGVVFDSPDGADALAIAITHCHVSQNAAQISETRLNLARGRLR